MLVTSIKKELKEIYTGLSEALDDVVQEVGQSRYGKAVKKTVKQSASLAWTANTLPYHAVDYIPDIIKFSDSPKSALTHPQQVDQFIANYTEDDDSEPINYASQKLRTGTAYLAKAFVIGAGVAAQVEIYSLVDHPWQTFLGVAAVTNVIALGKKVYDWYQHKQIDANYEHWEQINEQLVGLRQNLDELDRNNTRSYDELGTHLDTSFDDLSRIIKKS